MKPTYGSLFSGVGGFDLGFDAAGWECKWQVEWDARCRSVLARHWPDVARYGDVCDVGGVGLLQRDSQPASHARAQVEHGQGDGVGVHLLEPVDCITYGFPCQDLSVAGNRAGLDGERSGLFFEATRIIREMREATDGQYPRVAVAENVPGLLSADGGHAMGRVLDELADLGALGIEWATLDAQHFGVPQRRRRVFVVAWWDPRIGGADPLFPVAARCQGHPEPGATPGQDASRTAPRGAVCAFGGGLTDRSPALMAKAQRNHPDEEAFVIERETVGALLTPTGGPCVPDAQAGHLIVQPQSSPAKDAATATMWTARHG